MQKPDNSNKKTSELIVLVIAVCTLVCSIIFLVLEKYMRNSGEPGKITVINNAVQTADASSAQTTPRQTTTASVTSAAVTTTTSKAPDEPLFININTADEEELMKLSGIGKTLAAEIVRYRTKHGRFKNIEEIMNINGIGEGIFSSIRDMIYVENPIYETTTEAVTETETVTENVTEDDTEPTKTLEECAPININTAEKDELMLLPHVSEDIALEIIDLRTRLGKFSHPYELAFLDSLSRSQVAEILEYVCVE